MLKRLLTGLLLLSCCAVHAQRDDGGKALLQFAQRSDSAVNSRAPEKLYVQFDKPVYATGDTLWLKAYLFNASAQMLSSRSGLLYVDIANDSNRVVKQYLLPVFNGLCWGSLALDEKLFKPGDYTVRAYTSWMQNFGSDHFFCKTIRIAGINENAWLINANVDHKPDGLTYRAQLQLSGIDKKLVTDSALHAEVTDGRKVLSSQNVKTDQNGALDLTFALPPKTAKPAIVIQNKGRSKRAIVPINKIDPENTDVQFMPEGGYIIADLPARIGFKAIDSSGRGIAISGVVVDHRDSIVTSFKTLHNGMGSLYLNPQTDERYMAKAIFADGSTKRYPLPSVRSSGTLLQVKDLPGTDSLEVIVASAGGAANEANYYLLGKSRGVVCYAAVVELSKGQFIRSKVAKNRFPSGVAHFTLNTENGRPLNERLFYIDHKDELNIKIEAAQNAYLPKDSIALRLNVTDRSGHPVAGNFSMAVTDDAQVRPDSIGENIITRTLLTSELKGYVESPSFYLIDNDASRLALDNLLLTQGWVNYEPIDSKMPFKAESEFTVQGMVNNLFRSPVKKTHVVLFSRSPEILFDTVTNNEGRFVFNHFPRVDTPVFVLKAVNRAGRSFNVNIDVDEHKMPPFVAPKIPQTTPWYVNTDTIMINQVKNSEQVRMAAIPGGGRLLKEVQIKAKKVVKDSYNLNGPGNADLVLDEKDVEEAGKKTLLQLLEERIKGFRTGWFYTPGKDIDTERHRVFLFEWHQIRHLPASDWFFIYDKPVILMMDGVEIGDMINDFKYDDFLAFLKTHSAEDVKGIEVNFNGKYNNTYFMHGKWMEAPLALRSVHDYAFIEITTRSGHGAAITYTPGLYLYKPLAINWPKQFYKPKYTIKDTLKQADLRSTIDWEPNIATDSTGKAAVTFYAGSAPSSYTIITEGTDFSGNVGYRRRRITIGAAKSKAK